jgi:hypothetical protein
MVILSEVYFSTLFCFCLERWYLGINHPNLIAIPRLSDDTHLRKYELTGVSLSDHVVS